MQFELLVDQAGLATASAEILIDFYQSSLSPWLIERIYQGEVPTTLAAWKTRAILLDNNKRLAQAFTGTGGKSFGGNKFQGQGNKKKKFVFRRYPQPSNRQDDDAMDVDRLAVQIQRLSFEDQKRLMEKGLCFNCSKPGHFAVNCPDRKVQKQGKFSQGKKRYPRKQQNVRKTFTSIRALVGELDDEEMELFQQMADEEGFGGEEQDF